MYLSDLDEYWHLRINNNVFSYKVVNDVDSPDIIFESIIFKKLMTSNIEPITGILLSNRNATGENKRNFLEFVANFRE